MICFVINYYGEPVADLTQLVANIGTFYGIDAETFILGDSIKPPTVNGATSVTFPDRLKRREHGGAWTHRYLKFYLQNSAASHIIKIDPDTSVIGTALNLPMTDCIFCHVTKTLIGQREWWFPKGGALGFTRGMAQRIVDGDYFLDPYYVDKARFYSGQDRMLEDIMLKQRLPIMNRLDFSIWQSKPAPGAVFFHPISTPEDNSPFPNQ